MRDRLIVWGVLLLSGVGFVAFGLKDVFFSESVRDLPNILVVTLDTTRADRLGCYGHDGIRTPHIDAVAAEGILFEEAYSVQPVTLPSHASILTGKYPFHHGVRDNNIYRLAEENVTLAEVLKDRGYLTAAFVSSYILDRQFGLDQGFHFYNDRFLRPKQKGRLPVDRRASEVSLLACDWLEAAAREIEKRPFFLWVHYYDPHADYDPPHPYKTAYPDPYDGEIAYMDDWIGYLFDRLNKKGLWENTLVLIVGDHGESLGEYGEKTHGIFIYRPTTRVPLLLRLPRGVPKGLRITERVSTVDIVPTLLDAIGVAPETSLDGTSLLPLVQGRRAKSGRAIYSEAFIPRSFHWSELRGIRKGLWFYVDAPRPELYRVSPYGKEAPENLVKAHPRKAAALKSALEQMAEAGGKSHAERVPVDPDMIERLKSLGYFADGGGVAPEGDGDRNLPDPKDRILVFNAYQRACNLIAMNNDEAGARVLENVVARDPGNPRFYMELGSACMDLERYSEAFEHLERAVALRPRDARGHFLLGRCLEQWGRPERALGAYAQARQLSPQHFLACFHEGLVHTRQAQWGKAKEAFEAAGKIRPRDAATLNNLGFIAIKGQGDYEKGIAHIRQALSLSPENPMIMESLGSAYVHAGDYENGVRYLEAALALVPDDRGLIARLKELYRSFGKTSEQRALEKRERLIQGGG